MKVSGQDLYDSFVWNLRQTRTAADSWNARDRGVALLAPITPPAWPYPHENERVAWNKLADSVELKA